MSDDFIAIKDNTQRFAWGLYAKWNGGGRELDSGETERECVRQSIRERGSSIGTKIFT